MRTNIDRPLWTCPRCGKKFVTRNLWHSCVRVPLESHFAGKDPEARRLFDAYLAAVRENGPVRVVPSLTSIAFQTKVRFAGAAIRKRYIRCSLWLTRRLDDPRWARIEDILPNASVHTLVLRSDEQIDPWFRARISEAYAVGMRRHLIDPAVRVRRHR